MKKLLLFLLIIPSIGNSQVKSFDDLKQINSAQQFKRVVLENGYEKTPDSKDTLKEGYLSYGIGIVKREKDYGAKRWASYFIQNSYFLKKDEWRFEFVDLDFHRRKAICYFDIIVDEIKNQCKFYKVYENEYGNEIVLYSCPSSTYRGKIGFYTSSRGNGIIEHLIGR